MNKYLWTVLATVLIDVIFLYQIVIDTGEFQGLFLRAVYVSICLVVLALINYGVWRYIRTLESRVRTSSSQSL